MDKLERLLTLLLVLLETPRPLLSEELRARVPGYQGLASDAAFHRAFERDKDSLREMGVPLRLEAVPGTDPPREGYRVLPEEYYLRDPGLDPDELAALHLAASTVRVEGVQGMEGLWKLGGVVQEGAPPGSALPTAALPGDPNLPALFSAVTDRRRVRFTYNGVERDVEPHRLTIRRGHWYLAGLDLAKSDRGVVSFRVDRIAGAVAVGPEADAIAPLGAPADDRQPWHYGDEPPVTAEVLVDADQAPWAVRHLGDEAVVGRTDDGRVRLTMTVANRDAFRSFVLTFLDHAEVVGPPALRAEVVEWLEAIA